MTNLNGIKDKSKCVILTHEKYDSLKREILYYRKTIEELQDELDSLEAEKIKKESKGTKRFQLEDYVSDRNRAVGTKSIKKTSSIRQGKSRKIYSEIRK